MRFLLLLLWLLAVPGACQVTTWNTTPLDPGQVELDFFSYSSLARRAYDEHGSRYDLDGSDAGSVFYTGLGFGLTQDVDLWVFTSLTPGGAFDLDLIPRRGSQTDITLQARWRFLNDEESGWSMALLSGPLLQNPLTPTVPFLAWSEDLVVEKWLSEDLRVDAEVYYYFPLERNDSTFHQFGANLALDWDATEWLTPVAELNYYQALPQGGGSMESWAATLGTTVNLDALTLYLGYQYTFAGRNSEQFGTVITGFSVDF